MFDVNNELCKSCTVGIRYVRSRIGEEELVLYCKKRCGRGKDKPDDTTLNLFPVVLNDRARV